MNLPNNPGDAVAAAQGEPIVRRVAVVLGLALIAIRLFLGRGWLYMKFGMRGFSARAEPSHMEAMISEYAQDTAMAASAKDLRNPVVFTPAIQREAMAHYADHCAVCHANNGSGPSSSAGEGDGKLRPEASSLKVSRQLKALLDGGFLDRQENLLLFGNSGAGKSHLLCALALEPGDAWTADEVMRPV